MEIIFNDFSRKRSLLFPPLWSPPTLLLCTHLAPSLEACGMWQCWTDGRADFLFPGQKSLLHSNHACAADSPYSRANWNRKVSIEENCSFLFAPRVRRAVEPVSLLPALFAQALIQKFPSHRELCYPDCTCSQHMREDFLWHRSLAETFDSKRQLKTQQCSGEAASNCWKPPDKSWWTEAPKPFSFPRVPHFSALLTLALLFFLLVPYLSLQQQLVSLLINQWHHWLCLGPCTWDSYSAGNSAAQTPHFLWIAHSPQTCTIYPLRAMQYFTGISKQNRQSEKSRHFAKLNL